MKIVIYCQYVWGMGHYFRSMEIARALSGHEVILMAGGRSIDIAPPPHVRVVRLPALYQDEFFTKLIPEDPDGDVDEIRDQRRKLIFELMEESRPDVLIVELYPFGKNIFAFELDPLLEAAGSGRFGNTRTVCSLRDILVEKKKQAQYEARVIDKLNRYFHALLIHSDQSLVDLETTFSRVADIGIPTVYTGFVTRRPDPEETRRIRSEVFGNGSAKKVVASAGGGRSGFPLLKGTIGAFRKLENRLEYRLEVYTGPFMDGAEHDRLKAMEGGSIRVRRFTPHLLETMAAADLSISMAGYNTCMDLLVTGVPALVHPYQRQQEQPMRVERLQNLTPMEMLDASDLHPDRLAEKIRDRLGKERPPYTPSVGIDGSKETAAYLGKWLKQKKTL